MDTNGTVQNVEDLEVYQKLCSLAIEVNNLTVTFPRFELYELGSQLRRSSNSAPANLAEGFNNRHTNIYLEGINRAQGEIRESKHHLRIAFQKRYLDEQRLNYFLGEYDVCGRMLTCLGNSLNKRKR